MADAATRAALLRSAMALVSDPAEARAMVELALEAACAPEGHSTSTGDVDLFRRLREAYHSIEHSPSRRRTRDALVTSLAGRQRRMRAGQKG
jgi:hypothetical protein